MKRQPSEKPMGFGEAPSSLSTSRRCKQSTKVREWGQNRGCWKPAAASLKIYNFIQYYVKRRPSERSVSPEATPSELANKRKMQTWPKVTESRQNRRCWKPAAASLKIYNFMQYHVKRRPSERSVSLKATPFSLATSRRCKYSTEITGSEQGHRSKRAIAISCCQTYMFRVRSTMIKA